MVQIEVDCVLYGVRVTLLVQLETRISRERGPTLVLAFEPRGGHGERHARLEPGREHERPVAPHLRPGGYDVLGHVPTGVRVHVLGGRAWELDLLAAQNVRGRVGVPVRVVGSRPPDAAADRREDDHDHGKPGRHCSAGKTLDDSRSR